MKSSPNPNAPAGSRYWLQPSALLLCCVCSCSLQGFDYLNKGGTSSSGGAGGTPATSADGGAPSGGAGGDPSTGGSSEVVETGGTSCTGEFAICDGGVTCTNLEEGDRSGQTVNHCGSCETTCSLTNATSAACNAGLCVPTCKSGFANCNDTLLNDGCETDITLPAACGKCGAKCSNRSASSVACVAGTCAPTCLPRYADCNGGDGDAGTNDGCESFLDSLKACSPDCVNAVACGPSQVCNSGACGAAQGLVVFSIPFTQTGQIQRYADKLPTLPSLTDATVTLRVYAPGATAGTLVVYISDVDFTQLMQHNFKLAQLSTGWTDIDVPAGTLTGAYDPSSVYQITLEFRADDSGPWANPTIMYLDGIWSSNGAFNDTFSASLSNMIGSTMAIIQGSTMTWSDAMP